MAVRAGRDPLLPNRTTSFKFWAERLVRVREHERQGRTRGLDAADRRAGRRPAARPRRRRRAEHRRLDRDGHGLADRRGNRRAAASGRRSPTEPASTTCSCRRSPGHCSPGPAGTTSSWTSKAPAASMSSTTWICRERSAGSRRCCPSTSTPETVRPARSSSGTKETLAPSAPSRLELWRAAVPVIRCRRPRGTRACAAAELLFNYLGQLDAMVVRARRSSRSRRSRLGRGARTRTAAPT